MKTEYQIAVDYISETMVAVRFVARVELLPAKFSTDDRPVLRIGVTDNPLDAISGKLSVIKDICKFINKAAPHFGARVV